MIGSGFCNICAEIFETDGTHSEPKEVEVWYVGFPLGHRQVRPQSDKTVAIAACPRPRTKKGMRQVLGLAGYYRRFEPNFSDVTSPLTDLTEKEAPDPVQWTEPY